MVAFVTSWLVLIVGIGIAVGVAKRRPVGQPLTWGEAMVAATFVFFLLFWAYGVVPHQWLAWADNELRWRPDTYGIDLPIIGRVFEDGITFFGRGRILVNLQTVRDIIVVLIYGALLGGQIAAWVLWQKRGQAKPTGVATSRYGRPLVKPEQS